MEKTIKVKDYLKSIHFIKSDLFLVFGFLFFIPFAAFSWKFMVTSDPSQVFFNNRMIITCFSIASICWGIYLFLEAKNGRLKNSAFVWLFVFFTISSLVSVLVQPTDSIIDVLVRRMEWPNKLNYPGVEVGDIVTISTHISLTHRLFFACASILIPAIIYIILFILPKRLTNIRFLSVIGIIVMAFILVVTIYSFIAEHDKYVPFIKCLVQGNVYEMYKIEMSSFLVQRVPYGACLMMGLMFALVNHTFTRKWYWLVGVFYCFINMLFTWCKTGLAITFLILNIYSIYNLIFTFKKHLIRNIIISSIYLILIIGFLTPVLISVISKGEMLNPLYNLLSSFAEKETILTRTYIWANIRQRLSGGWLVIGRGFGIHNYVLYPMNLVNGDDVCPSHSSYYAVLGAGGLIQLIGYLGMMVLYLIFAFKCFRKDKLVSFGLFIPFLAFFLYSFTEGVNYLVIVFMFPIILFYNLIKRELNTPK